MHRIAPLSLLVPLVALAACVVHVEDQSADIAAFDFTSFDILNSSGSLDIVAGDEPSLEVELQWTGEEAPVLDIQLDGTTLVVRLDCPPQPRGCSADYEIVLPSETSLVAFTSSGATQVRGMGADLDVESSSGSVEITGHTGDVAVAVSSGGIVLDDVTGAVDLRASSGGIDGRRLDTLQLAAVVTSGSVVLELVASPDAVGIESSSGGVDLTLPVDDYDLRLATSSGLIDVVGLVDDDRSERVIDIRTSSGGISVRGQ